jgi:hypothetical protein
MHLLQPSHAQSDGLDISSLYQARFLWAKVGQQGLVRPFSALFRIRIEK